MANLSSHAGGGNIYVPAMQKYDGDSGYLSLNITSTGNKATGMCRINLNKRAGTAAQSIFRYRGSGGQLRLLLLAYDSTHGTTAYRDQLHLYVSNSGGTGICRLIANRDCLDGNDHYAFFSFDGDAGAATFYIDGTNADDTADPSRVAPTTGTLDTGAGTLELGAYSVPSNYLDGSIGYVGCKDAYLTNPGDFFIDGNVVDIDTSGWTEWGSQPLVWNENGDLWDRNDGSLGVFTKTADVWARSSSIPMTLGLNTTGTAVAADIATGKTAWVNGVKITGTAV